MSRIARRTLLKGAALLPVGHLAGASPLPAAGRERPRFIIDHRLQEADHIAARARAQGCPVADPECEIIRLLLDRRDPWLSASGAIIGLTGWSDLMLAQDALRMAGRPLLHASALRDGKEERLIGRADSRAGATLASLLGGEDMRRPARTTSFVWAA